MSNAKWISMEFKRKETGFASTKRQCVQTAPAPIRKGKKCRLSVNAAEGDAVIMFKYLDDDEHCLYHGMCPKSEIASKGSLCEVGQLLIVDTDSGPLHALIVSISDTLKSAIQEASEYLSHMCPEEYDVDKNGILITKNATSEDDPRSPNGISVVPPESQVNRRIMILGVSRRDGDFSAGLCHALDIFNLPCTCEIWADRVNEIHRVRKDLNAVCKAKGIPLLCRNVSVTAAHPIGEDVVGSWSFEMAYLCEEDLSVQNESLLHFMDLIQGELEGCAQNFAQVQVVQKHSHTSLL